MLSVWNVFNGKSIFKEGKLLVSPLQNQFLSCLQVTQGSLQGSSLLLVLKSVLHLAEVKLLPCASFKYIKHILKITLKSEECPGMTMRYL